MTEPDIWYTGGEARIWGEEKSEGFPLQLVAGPSKCGLECSEKMPLHHWSTTCFTCSQWIWYLRKE